MLAIQTPWCPAFAHLEHGRVGACELLTGPSGPHGHGYDTWSAHGGRSTIEEKDAPGARNRHSDKEKFRSDLNRPEGCKMSERLLKTLWKFADFQAEYKRDDSLHPLQRFQYLNASAGLHSDKPCCFISTSGSRLFAAGLVKVSLDNRPYRPCIDSIRMAVRQPASNGLSGVLLASGECIGVAFSNPCAR